MPDTRDAIEFVKYIPAVIHHRPYDSCRVTSVLQLLRTQRVMQLPSEQKRFKLTRGRDANKCAPWVFGRIVHRLMSLAAV